MYRRKLKALNRNKLIVFTDSPFGIFLSHEVFMLAGVPVHDAEKILKVTREQIYPLYTGVIPSRFFLTSFLQISRQSLDSCCFLVSEFKIFVDNIEQMLHTYVQIQSMGVAVEDNTKKSDGTKAKLIVAAGGVFAERGFRSATVREICSRAGTPLNAMNYHFRDKQGLYTAVLEYSHETAIRKYPPALGVRDGSTPEEKLRAFIHTFLLRLLDTGVPAWHMKLMFQEISDPTGTTGALGQVVERSIRPLYTYLLSILSELLKEENPSAAEESDEIFMCAMSIVGQCCHYYTGRRVIAALHPKSFDLADIDGIADHITRFSLTGIRELAAGKSR